MSKARDQGDRVLDLVQKTYDAALDERLWPGMAADRPNLQFGQHCAAPIWLERFSLFQAMKWASSAPTGPGRPHL